MLILPIKKKWFDMILSGEKKEEYREIKPYYKSRFEHDFDVIEYHGKYINAFEENPVREIMFRNGYSKTSPSFIARCTLDIGQGKKEWGAGKGKQYFILTIHEILEGN